MKTHPRMVVIFVIKRMSESARKWFPRHEVSTCDRQSRSKVNSAPESFSRNETPLRWLATTLPLPTVATAAIRMVGKMRRSWLIGRRKSEETGNERSVAWQAMPDTELWPRSNRASTVCNPVSSFVRTG